MTRIMAAVRGRGPERGGFAQGHRKTTTLVEKLRTTGLLEPMVLDGPINGAWSEA